MSTATKNEPIPSDVRRILALLIACVTIFYCAAVMMTALAPVSLLALTGAKALAGLPPALSLVGGAIAASFAGRAMDVHGRKPVLVIGFVAGAVSTAVVAAALELRQAWLLIGAFLLTGGATGIITLARLAGADLFPPARRGRGVALVLTGAVVGGILGPFVFMPLAANKQNTLDSLRNAWLVGSAVMALGAIVAAFVSPDPSVIAARYAVAQAAGGAKPQARAGTLAEVLQRPGVRPTLFAGVVAHGMMVAAMSLGSVIMSGHHHHSKDSIFVAIGVHFVGMFGLMLLAGEISDRLGVLVTEIIGLVLVAAAVLGLGFAHTMVEFSVAMFVLGLGWNFTFLAATAHLASKTAPMERGRLIGLNDVSANALGAALAITGGAALASVSLHTVSFVAAAISLLPIAPLLLTRGASNPRAKLSPPRASVDLVERPVSERILATLSELSASPRTAIRHFKDGQVRDVTFADLQRDVLQARERLARLGVRAGTRVGILASNSYEWVVYDLAVTAAAGALVAFPFDFKERPIESLFDEYEIALLFISKADGLKADDSAVAYLEGEDPARPTCRRATSDDPRQPSLVFGSGTEGKAKAMAVRYDGMIGDLDRIHSLFELDACENLLLFLPLSVIQQRSMLYFALLFGHELSLVAPKDLRAGLQALKPTLLVAPPLFYESVHKQFEATLANLSGLRGRFARFLASRAPNEHAWPFSSLARRMLYRPVKESMGGRAKVFLVGMAVIQRATLEFFQRAEVPLFEAYGLSETGVIACNRPGHNRLGSVGEPLYPGTVEVAADGEILVRRPRFITSCYLGVDPEVNQRVYVAPDLIATGDLGRIDADGFLYISGRKKQTIVLTSGFKVQPEELEKKLLAIPGVAHAVALGSGLPSVIGVLSVAPETADSDFDAIHEAVAAVNSALPQRGRLQEYRIVRERFTTQNGLLTPNLKVKRDQVEKHFAREIRDMTSMLKTELVV